MIEVKNLSKVFEGNNKRVVDDISFRVEVGKIACIVGTSGCGKTTTLKMINRLIEPSSGEVKVNNETAFDVDPIEWRRKIGFVIQKGGLLPHLNIEENISLLARVLKTPIEEIEKRVKELMAIVNLSYSEQAKKFPSQLSGGQQQRVGIARALMQNPPVMLMDEPFGALDPITRDILHQELIHLNQKLKKTILIVTHDMDEAVKLGDSIILMNEGRIVQQGTRQELIESPNNEFVKNFFKGIEI